jgi:hypothetical protein
MLKVDSKPVDATAGTIRADGRKAGARAGCRHGDAGRCAAWVSQQQGGA